MTPHIRPFDERDYPAVAAVNNAVYHEYPFSVDSARHEDSRYDGTRLHLRRFVAEVDGRIVADAEFHHVSNMYHPQKFWVDLSVHPGHQSQGIGRALYEHLLRELAPYRPLTLWTGVRETFDRSIAFAEHRGFREVRRAWESRLDVTRFDPAPFRAKANAGIRGMEIVTVASEQDADARWLEKLYDMHNEIAADVPQPEPYTPMTLEEFRRRWFGNPEYRPDGHFVLYQGITGTRRAARGRGIALALKLRTIEYGRTHGRREIRTWNDTLNAPMLAINTALGFVRQPAWITYERTL